MSSRNKVTWYVLVGVCACAVLVVTASVVIINIDKPLPNTFTISNVNGTYIAKRTDGTVLTSGTNAAMVINAAVSVPGSIVNIEPGIYMLTEPILPANNTRLVGYGATLTTIDTSLKLIEILGSRDYSSSRDAIATIGSNLISTDTTRLSAGDTIELISDDLWVPWVWYGYMASLHTIFRIVDANTLELSDPIYLDYQTNTSLMYVSLKDGVSIEGLILEGAGMYINDSGNFGILTNWASNVNIKDVTILNCSICAIGIYDTLGATIDGVSISGSHKVGEGYGISVANTARNIMVNDSVIEYCRHGGNNGASDAGVPSFVSYHNTTFRHNEEERQHSIGLAIGYDHCIFYDVGHIVLECSGAYITNSLIQGLQYISPGDPVYNVIKNRSDMITVGHTQAYASNVSIINNTIQYSYDELVGDELNVFALQNAENCEILRNTITYTGTPSSLSSAIKIWPVVPFNNVLIFDNIFNQATTYGVRGIAGQEISDVDISGNTFTVKYIENSINLESNFFNVTISNNNMQLG
jgi:hypothetical protein